MREASTAVGNCARVRSLRDCLQRRQWTWWSMHAFGNGGGTTVRLLWRWPWAKSWQTFERRSSRAKKTLLDVAPSILMSKLVTNFRTHMAGWRKIKLRKMLISLQWQPHFWNRKNPCWSIVGVTIGAVSNPPGCLWFNWFVKFTPHYYPRLFHIDMNNDLFSLTIYDDVPLKQMVIFNSKPLKKGQQVSCASQCDLPNLPC